MQASFERDGTGISSSIGDASSTFTGDAADDASRVRSTARHDETVDNVSLDEEAQNGGAGQEIGIDAFKTVALADELKKVEVKEEGDTEEGDKEEGDKERLPMGLRCFGIGLVVLLILVAIFLGIYFGGDRKPRSNEPNEEIGAVENEGIPTGSPSTSTHGYILDALDDYADAEVLTDPTTPQGQAFLQLVQEEDTAENRPTPVFTVGQRYALMTLYLSTEPSAWMVDNGWDGFVGDECTWYGVSCEGSVVTNVEISDNGMGGSLPGEICILSNLELLDLGTNTISGPIPKCVAGCENLNVLVLNENELSGGLPEGLLTLRSIEVVDVSDNKLDGPLDALFAGDSSSFPVNLKTFEADGNKLTGGIPSDFGFLPTLTSLFLYANQLSGPVDDSVCNLDTVFLQDGGFMVDCSLACACCTADNCQ